MEDLERFTMKEVIDGLAEEVALEYDISMTKARQVVLNALTYNTVAFEVLSQVGFLLGKEKEQ